MFLKKIFKKLGLEDTVSHSGYDIIGSKDTNTGSGYDIIGSKWNVSRPGYDIMGTKMERIPTWIRCNGKPNGTYPDLDTTYLVVLPVFTGVFQKSRGILHSYFLSETSILLSFF